MIEDRRLCLSARRAGDPLLIGNTRHCIEYFLTAIVSVTEVTDCAREYRDLNLF